METRKNTEVAKLSLHLLRKCLPWGSHSNCLSKITMSRVQPSLYSLGNLSLSAFQKQISALQLETHVKQVNETKNKNRTHFFSVQWGINYQRNNTCSLFLPYRQFYTWEAKSWSKGCSVSTESKQKELGGLTCWQVRWYCQWDEILLSLLVTTLCLPLY